MGFVGLWRDRWSVRFTGALATITIGVPVVTFGSVAYWDELTTSEVAVAADCTPTSGTQLAPDPDTAIAIGPNGELLDTTRTTNPATNTITITVGDTTLNFTPEQNGQLDTTGRLVLTHPARVRVTATGMLPNTTATVWIMSNPQRLGTITVATDGTIDTTYAIPTNIEPGNHTIQIDTAAISGDPIAIALGLTITTGLLPTTGTNTNTHLTWLILMIAIGALTTLTTTGNRRKHRSR